MESHLGPLLQVRTELSILVLEQSDSRFPRRASFLDNGAFRKLENNLIPPSVSIFPAYRNVFRLVVQEWLDSAEDQGAKKEADPVL